MTHDSLVSKIQPVIDSLNAQYGKGDIGQIQLFFDAYGTFTQTPFKCKPTIKKFHIVFSGKIANGIFSRMTIFALGHKKTVKLSD